MAILSWSDSMLALQPLHASTHKQAHTQNLSSTALKNLNAWQKQKGQFVCVVFHYMNILCSKIMMSYWYQMDKSRIQRWAKIQCVCIYVVIYTYIKFKDMQHNSISCSRIYAYVIKVLKCIDMLNSGQKLPLLGKKVLGECHLYWLFFLCLRVFCWGIIYIKWYRSALYRSMSLTYMSM